MQHEPRVVLVFEVDGHRYAVDTKVVQEIVRAVLPARLPGAPSVIAGVINARGVLVPLVDLRARFGFVRGPIRASDVFVIVRSERRLLALIVDSVSELSAVAESSIAETGTVVPEAPYVAGAVMLPEGVLLLCDIELFLDQLERAMLDAALTAALASEDAQA